MELDELRTNLAGFIVHDLKGPITTIMANLDMLNYEPLTLQQFEYVNLATE
jgi:K+-sensing histidine kinase KdpD